MLSGKGTKIRKRAQKEYSKNLIMELDVNEEGNRSVYISEAGAKYRNI